jgi:prolyl-tRNA synthetase
LRFSKLFIPTTKEAPKDAVLASHIYLVRGGFVSQIGSGIYNFLPLGKVVLDKIRQIVKQEMDAAGAHETQLGFITPTSLWKESGRYDKFGKELLRFKDRKNNEFVLGPTHEEAMVDLVRSRVKSYKQLPLHLYQINTKFRDEARPRYGILRGREFLMKDGYSFHESMEDVDREFGVMEKTYSKILERLGLKYRVVDADSGSIGGSGSKEFMVLADSGEDDIVVCSNCQYAANIEAATRKQIEVDEYQSIYKKAILEDSEEYIEFQIAKDDTLQEVKAQNACEALDLVDVDGIPTNVDRVIKDIELAEVCEGDICVDCGSKLEITKGIEVGHIFQLGDRYSKSLNATFLDRDGKSQPYQMGTYGIGVSRLVAAVIEQNHDDKGCIWTKETSPFEMVILISNIKDDEQREFAEDLYEKLKEEGINVLLDDRPERFGFKMKDFELLGFLKCVIVGKDLKDGNVQIVDRKTLDKSVVNKNEVFDKLCHI